MKNLDESIVQVLTVGGNNMTGTAKVQPLTITGGPPWLKQQVTEEAPKENKELDPAVKDALEQIAKGKTYDEWAKETDASPEVKDEVMKRIEAEGEVPEEEPEGDEAEQHAGPSHDKDHLTKAMFDTLPDDEKAGHHDDLRQSLDHHGFKNGNGKEEEEPEGEEEGGEEEPMDYEIQDGEGEEEPKEKPEPKMKLSKKKEKVTVNPKLEQIEAEAYKEHSRKKLIEDLKEKRKKRFKKHVKDISKEDDLPDIEKEVEKNINIQHPNDIEDHNRKLGYKEDHVPGHKESRAGLPTREWIKKSWADRAQKSKAAKLKKISHPGYEEFTKEEAPPGREDQVKALKKKVGTDKAYAFAWAQHNKHGEPVKEANEMENIIGHRSTPFEVLKTLKDRVDAKDPTAIQGQSFSDFENERLQQLERMVRPGVSVLMFMDKPVGHYDLEEYVFVMREKIPKYEEMGYKIVAE